ncbi:hypothetical protein ACP6PL_27205 [Dapis sp. BLCC M126]|uniref:hypothetical protein n=1 Tax=Dapis sp. BLCC M126 TaxID=3400189 RepID=UPI003CED3E59
MNKLWKNPYYLALFLLIVSRGNIILEFSIAYAIGYLYNLKYGNSISQSLNLKICTYLIIMKLITLILLLPNLNLNFVELLFMAVFSIIFFFFKLPITYGGLDAGSHKYLI